MDINTDKLLIHKVGTRFYHKRNIHLDPTNKCDYMSSFEYSITNGLFQIVEVGGIGMAGANRFIYKVENISIKIDNGIVESSFDVVTLGIRFESIRYPKDIDLTPPTTISQNILYINCTTGTQTYSITAGKMAKLILRGGLAIYESNGDYTTVAGSITLTTNNFPQLETGNQLIIFES